MAFYGAFYWWSPDTCLDEAFDAPDVAADHELCQAIAAGKLGPHPDGWGNHDPLPLRWLLRDRRDEEPPPAYEAYEVDPAWVAKHRRSPVVAPPPPPEIFTGEIELTCDHCHRQFWLTLGYKSGERPTKAMHLLAMGRREGWTHIDGRDRCPECSIVARENVGNGTGERDHDKQYTDGG